jgi:hypothetical protein
MCHSVNRAYFQLSFFSRDDYNSHVLSITYDTRYPDRWNAQDITRCVRTAEERAKSTVALAATLDKSQQAMRAQQSSLEQLELQLRTIDEESLCAAWHLVLGGSDLQDWRSGRVRDPTVIIVFKYVFVHVAVCRSAHVTTVARSCS